MIFTTAAWLSSLQSFEDSVGLSQQASLGRFSKESPLYVCILNGINEITDEYRELLASGSINLIDCTHLTHELLRGAPFEQGLSYVNQYEAYCFLRWLVFAKVFGGESFIHIDTDLFLNLEPSTVAGAMAGLTGTFGSPCFAVISDYEWIRIYEEQLHVFIKDRSGFEAKYLGPDRLALRSHIGSDQDFVSVLNGNDLIPNSLPNRFDDTKFRAFVNPLWPYRSKPNTPMALDVVNGISSIDGTPILFWHLQNDFCRYLARYYFIADMIGDGNSPHEDFQSLVIPNPYSKLFPSPAAFPFAAIDKYFRVLAQESPGAFDTTKNTTTTKNVMSEYNPYVRKNIYRRFLNDDKDKLIFSSVYWWEDGIWE